MSRAPFTADAFVILSLSKDLKLFLRVFRCDAETARK
jgi:hypothetical protein